MMDSKPCECTFMLLFFAMFVGNLEIVKIEQQEKNWFYFSVSASYFEWI